MNWARSPHVFDDGVTLTMSPSKSFASAYAFFTAGHCSARPFCVACAERLRHETAQNRKEDHPAPSLMETRRVDGVSSSKGHRTPRFAWKSMFVYWPPGISCA